jgi:putative aminopeptidase FrvX
MPDGTIESAPAVSRLLEGFETLARVPVAPFREHWVCAELERLLDSIPSMERQADRFGNRIARVARGETARGGFAFVAHVDHPGFTFPMGGGARAVAPNRYEALFEGYVTDPYFHDARVRLFRSPEDPGVGGRIVHAEERDPAIHARRVTIEAEQNADGAVLATWDLPAFDVCEGLVTARGCDDLAGCAVLLEALRRLGVEGEGSLTVVFTRAEEPGFCGTLCLLAELGLPSLLDPHGTYVSVEASRERSDVVPGAGAVIRVGDHSTTFDNSVTDTLWAAATLAGIPARRALMDGGNCEATPLARAGLRAGGLCVPLRNYHNMSGDDKTLAPECVAVSDLEALAGLVVAVARTPCEQLKPPLLPQSKFDLFLEIGRRNLLG